ncbi:hypothetical protein MHBO_002097 [Bonamia ostreae]|uniref:Uncharacterized protein n=1 Tax=Bonamia ostreae TaxID=126728 RepID=A0ABV2ALW1_9EUKA
MVVVSDPDKDSKTDLIYRPRARTNSQNSFNFIFNIVVASLSLAFVLLINFYAYFNIPKIDHPVFNQKIRKTEKHCFDDKRCSRNCKLSETRRLFRLHDQKPHLQNQTDSNSAQLFSHRGDRNRSVQQQRRNIQRFCFTLRSFSSSPLWRFSSPCR